MVPSVKKAFDLIAGEWNEYRQKPSPVLDYFLSITPRNSICLDAGCGNGRNAIAIAGKAKRVYAIDFSSKMLENARKAAEKNGLLDRMDFVEADVRSLPLSDVSIDRVFSLATLHHLETTVDRKKAFREMFRVLKPGGRVFLCVWNKRQPKFESLKENDSLVSWKARDGKTVKRFYHFFEAEELESLAANSGFSVKQVFFEKNGKKTGIDGAANVCAVLERP